MSHSEVWKQPREHCYCEQQGASTMDILFVYQLHDEAAKRWNQSEKQYNITSFFFVHISRSKFTVFTYLCAVCYAVFDWI